MVKIRTFQAPAILMLTCLLSSVCVYGSQLEAYSDTTNAQFTLTDINDQTHSLSDYKGKVVLVNFWASWCPPCIYEMPELKKLKKHFAGKAFEILAINVGEKKYSVRKFAKLTTLSLPVLLDTSSETFENWGAKTLPTSFLIDVDGQIRYRVRGSPGWEDEQTLALISQLIMEAEKSAKP